MNRAGKWPVDAIFCPIESSFILTGNRFSTVPTRSPRGASIPKRNTRAMAELDQLAARYQDWLVEKGLPLWSSKGVDSHGGGFHKLLGDDGVAPPAPKRARVQARQSFTFLYAQAMGWDGPWADVAYVGLDHLNRFYLRPDGLYATLADRAGTILDSTAMTYDQAFVLLALAYVYKRTGDADARGKAEALMARLTADRGLPNGGFREANDAFL